MRLFVALWPPPAALDALEALPRPEHLSLRWTTRPQWHVTLRFLGDVDPDAVPRLVDALDAHLRSQPAPEVELGPAVTWLGRPRRSPLVVPLVGADETAAAVAAATAGVGEDDDRPWRGHVTLARVRRGAIGPRAAAGHPVHARWRADRVALVRSHLDGDGARYETVAEVALRGATPPTAP